MQETTQRPATKFTMRGLQLLASGTTTEPLAIGEHMWLHSKVYSHGGENAFHSHEDEEHAFFVLHGAVVFSFRDGSTTRTARFEGILIPKGVQYRFETEHGNNVIMIRVGAFPEKPANGFGTVLDLDGNPMYDDRAAARGKTPSEPVVALPGQFFEPEETR
jgi:mannose-6-phosphate isomerase-like protein (cupin superfamily)